MLFRGGVAAGTEQIGTCARRSSPPANPGRSTGRASRSMARCRRWLASWRCSKSAPTTTAGATRSGSAIAGRAGRAPGATISEGSGSMAGSSFSGNTYGMQVGQDLYARTSDSGHQDRYGVFLGYASANGDVRGDAMGQRGYRAGKLGIQSHSVGAYWTHVGPGGWYTDTVILGSRLKVNPTSNAGDTRATRRAFTASVEAGLPIALKPNLSLEPQAQLIYQHTRIDSVRDAASDVSFAPKNALIGRAAAAGRVPGSTRHLEALFAGRPGAHAGDATRSASAATRPPRRARVAPRPGWAWALPWTPANASAFPRPPATASTWAASGARRCRAIWGCESAGERCIAGLVA